MGAYATGNPLYPPPYVAGIVTLPQANTPYNLMALIQQQLNVNCMGAGQEVTLQAIPSTGNTVYIGEQQNLNGLLSTTNYGYQLPAGYSRTYRSGYPGHSSPVQDLWVLMTTTAGGFSVEVVG